MFSILNRGSAKVESELLVAQNNLGQLDLLTAAVLLGTAALQRWIASLIADTSVPVAGSAIAVAALAVALLAVALLAVAGSFLVAGRRR